jgi:hypothetical protein
MVLVLVALPFLFLHFIAFHWAYRVFVFVMLSAAKHLRFATRTIAADSDPSCVGMTKAKA